MATINIFGEIGWDVIASEVITEIQNVSDDTIEVIIASGGGSAFEGLMIFDALKASGKTISTKIMGLGASAASVIFMAGDTREMGEGSLLMVHNSWSMFMGNAEEVRDQLGTLDAIDDRMTSIFINATGLEESEVRELLSDETFMGAEKAQELGFATGVIEAQKVAASIYRSVKNKKKEPETMATEEQVETIDEKDKGLFAKFLAWMKAEEPKAEEVEEEEVVEETAKAETDEDKKEMEALKAENEKLKEELAEANASSKSAEQADEESVEKANLILDAMAENKITMNQAKNLSSKPLSEVSDALVNVEANATGAAKTEEPKEEAITDSKKDTWKAMINKGEFDAAQKFYMANQEEINKDKES